jgi:hypothetical protein
MAMVLAERIERPASLFGPDERDLRTPAPDAVARERYGDPGGGLTLDDAIVGAWEGLAARVVVACPLCSGTLRPHGAPDALGGRCCDCGTSLD